MSHDAGAEPWAWSLCHPGAVDDDHRMSAAEPLTLVDVDLFVSAGAPRAAFVRRPSDSGSIPTFDLDRAVLESAGWAIDDSSFRPPARSSLLRPPPHPYALGPTWTGCHCWRADFGGGATGIIDHDWCNENHPPIEGGPPLTSRSPWRWAFSTDSQRAAGRAASPLHAAAFVEALASKSGVTAFVASPPSDGVRAPG